MCIKALVLHTLDGCECTELARNKTGTKYVMSIYEYEHNSRS